MWSFGLFKDRDRNKTVFDINRSKEEILSDSISGCLIGGAFGDALGYPVEFLSYSQIISKYGKSGITKLEHGKGGKAEISDDTQMTLFTANGLLYAHTRGCLRGIAGPMSGYVIDAYQEWYETQTDPDKYYNADQFHTCWIHNIACLHNRRAPGNTCLSAIAESFGKTPYKADNNSKGCGGVMRVAPVGCFGVAGHSGDEAYSTREAADIAELTHGHPLGYIPAAFLSCMVHMIIKNKAENRSKSLCDITTDTLSVIKSLYGNNEYYGEFENIIDRAVELSRRGLNDVEAVSQLGEGWVAEEALAIALYSALTHQNDFRAAIICAVNHNGDSDSTGAIAGNILGAYSGLNIIDPDGDLTASIEAGDIILELAHDLAEGCKMEEYGDYRDEKWMSKYVYCNYGKGLS